MEYKTKVSAEAAQQVISIEREFDLPVSLLFKAFVVPEIVEQWMGTSVLKLESKKHGSFHFATTDPKGNVHHFSGAIHAFQHNEKIIRTFEMEGMPFGVQLEILEFESITDQRSRLNKKVIYESVSQRDANLKLPFKQGINLAHNRLEEIVTNINRTQ